MAMLSIDQYIILKFCKNNLICTLILFLFSGIQPLNAQTITSYRSLRYQQTVGQTNIYTCGAAAVATLFTHFYNQPVGEAEMLEIAERIMEESGKNPQKSGLNAFSLKQALIIQGIDADVKEVTLEQLRRYFNQGGLPIVIHVATPQPHYILAIGMVEDWLIVSDPTLGRGMFPLNNLNTQKGFSGIVIMSRPLREAAQVARQQQQISQDWADGRLQRLNTMKRSIM